MPRGGYWTEREDAILLLNLSWDELRVRLPGRPVSGIKRRKWFLGLSAEERAEIRTSRRGEYRKEPALQFHVAPMIVPDCVIAARERRELAAQQRTVTATICGDPPPGYSALDRMTA